MSGWNEAVDWLIRMSGWGAVAIGAVLLLQMLVGRWIRPQWRYGLWMLVMLRLMLPVAPESGLSIYQFMQNLDIKEHQAAGGAKLFVGQLPVVTNQDKAMENGGPTAMPEGPHWQITIPQIIVAVWLAGVIVMLTGLRRGMSAARKIVESSAGQTVLQNLAREVRSEAGLKREVPVRCSDNVRSPMLVGIRNPVVLLPSSMVEKYEAGEYAASELRHVLLHEFMHFKRGDMWAAGVGLIIRGAYWFHPLVWIAVAQLRREQEMACDADVLRMSNGEQDKVDYGRTLVRLADDGMAGRLTAGALGIVEKKSQLRSRIEMIGRYRNGGWMQTAVGMLLVATVVATTFTDARAEEPAPEQSSPNLDAPTALTDNRTKNPDLSKPGAFKVMVDPDKGQLVYTYNEKTNELESMEAKTSVSFEMAHFIITSDNISIKVGERSTSESLVQKMGLGTSYTLTADKGEVRFKRKGSEGMHLTADTIIYRGTDDEFELEGNATIFQKDADGKVTTTRANNARVQLSPDGKMQMRMKANTSVNAPGGLGKD